MEKPQRKKENNSKEPEDHQTSKQSRENSDDKAKKKPKENPYTFKNFMKPTTCVLYLIGLILWPRTNYAMHKLCLLVFFISVMSINLDIACEVYELSVFMKTTSTLIELTELTTYVIYTVLSEIKLLYIFANLKKINKLLITLNDMFPVTDRQLAAYNVELFRKKILLLTIPGIIAMWSSVTFYTGSTVIYYLFFFDRSIVREMSPILQFYTSYPFPIKTAGRFFAVVFQQFHCSQMVALAVTGSEALLTFIILNVCMQLDWVVLRLKRNHRNGDIKDLSIIVHHHETILQIMNEANETFNVPVFITFLSSTFSMCFVGFQIMNATRPVDIIKFTLFMSYEVIRVFVTSLLGNMLMDVSLNVGDAAYETNWYENTIQYQKCIHLIIYRSQKPANLNAITFHEACLISFKEICSKSYTFFTVLHTMYDD